MARYPVTYCSQCGNAFGPGDHGFSHCKDHKTDEQVLRATLAEYLAADDAMTAFLLAADADKIGEVEWARQHKAAATRRRNAALAAHSILKATP